MDADDLTFLLTDIEGSTRLWNAHPGEMLQVVARHNRLLTDAVEGNRGLVFKDTGDGMWASFGQSSDGILAAIDAQMALAAEDWKLFDELRVRMGLHRGFTLRRATDHCGQTINLTARLGGLADGGQILVTGAVLDACQREARDLGDVELLDLGSHLLRDLPDPVRIHQVLDARLERRIAHNLTSIDPRPALPEPMRELFGRAIDLEQISQLVVGNPLVTVTGAPGIGKSRVALRVANSLREQFAGGAVHVESSARDVEGFLLDLGSALGIYRYSQDALLDVIAASLTSHPSLVVLDGFESLVGFVHEPLRSLVQRCPAARFLVTSTLPLGIDAERVRLLGPLAITSDTGEIGPAVELLLETRSVDGLATRPSELAALTALCEAVDGVPLAIELLGSRTTVQDPSSVLETLADIDTAAPLRTVLAQAFDRLSEPAAGLLEILSVFEGSFTLHTVVAVCDDLDEGLAPQLLAELQHHSLVARFRQQSPDLWFRVLQPIRLFVRERVDPTSHAALRKRLAERIAELVVVWTEAVRGRDELVWAEHIEGHFAVIAQAHDWAAANGRNDLADMIITSLWDFAHTRMRSEVWIWAEQAIASTRTTPASAEILGVAALGAWRRGDAIEALRLSAAALDDEREHDRTPTIPARLAILDTHSYATNDDAPLSEDLTWAYVDLFEVSAAGHPYWAVNVYVLGAIGLSFLGEGDAARKLADDGLALGRPSQNPSTVAWALFGAAVAYESLDEALAEAYADEAVRVARKVGNIWVESIATGLLVTLRRRVAGGRAAAPLLLSALEGWERRSHVAQQWHSIRAAGFALLQGGETSIGVQLITAASGAAQAMPLLPSEQAEVTAALSSANKALDGTPLRKAHAAGQVLDLAGATAMARDNLALL